MFLPILMACLLWSTFSYAQTNLPNLDLEDWESSSSGRFENPTGGEWATSNDIVDIAIFPPSTNPVEKSSDAFSGSFSAQLTTIEVFGTLSSATLFTGEFDLNITSPSESVKFGRPFTGKPTSLRGYYKSNSIMQDSFDMYITLFNEAIISGEPRGDTVAHAQFTSNETVGTWTPFELTLDYHNANDVDSIQIVFASSAEGASFAGQLGNTLWIDNLELYYAPVGISQVLMPEIGVKTFPNPAVDQLNIELEKELPNNEFLIMAADGKIVKRNQINGLNEKIDVSQLTPGIYFYLLNDEKGYSMNSGSFVIEK